VLQRSLHASDIDRKTRAEAALRAINAQLAAVLASIDECYCTVDHDGRVTSVNDAAVSRVGVAPGDLIGRSLGDVLPGLGGREFEDRLRSALAKRAPFRLELESKLKPGQWLEIHGYPWADGLSMFFRDISRRKAAEEALHRATILLQGTMDALSAEIVVLDGAGIIIAANAAQRRFRGGQAWADLIGTHYLALCEAMMARADYQAICGGLRAVVERRASEFRIHYRRRSGGAERWFQMRATRFGGDVPYVVIAHEDVTEIAETREQLQRLAGRILRVQDEERRRIARDIHDTTVQHLVAALMSLDWARRGADGASLDEVGRLIEGSIQELRTLSYLLHPPLLEELGLVSALRWFVRGFEKRSGITVALEVIGDLVRASPEVESALFRVVQEAMTNVLRHSGSATALVRLSQGDGEIIVEVIDRGHGFPEEMQDSGDDVATLGVGISGMRMRLHHLGGSLDIRSSDAGTCIRARVPLGGTCAAPIDAAQRTSGTDVRSVSL
jgi:two-component system, NarL family, sensor kinase